MSGSFTLAELGIHEDSEYHRLLARCPDAKTVMCEDGEHLIHQDDATHDVYLVLKGAYVVEVHGGEGEEHPGVPLATVLSSPRDPSFVGEMAYLGGGFRSASVRVTGRTYALALRPGHLDTIMAEFPILTRALCLQFAARLREANHLISDYQDKFAVESELIVRESGELLFDRGQPADTLFQLVEGTVVRETEDGAEEITSTMPHEGFIEPESFFAGSSRRSRVTAKTRVMVVAVKREGILGFVRRYPDLLLGLYKEVANR